MKKEIIRLDTTTSTSDVLKAHPTPAPGTMTVAVAAYQTHGRGQARNTWESERGKNLLMSILTGSVGIAANRQFVLSMAGALALKDAMGHLTDGISLKWPNDIYWRDRKLSGTLIEASLAGRSIQRCIYGIGLNVNQRVFTGDAPNPVSLYNITGRETPTEHVLDLVLDCFENYYQLATGGGERQIADEYNASLFWRDGIHQFEDTATHTPFMASISHVGCDGLLHLALTDGTERQYALKEVRFCI